MKFGVRGFFEKSWENPSSLKSDKNNAFFYEDLCKFVISRSSLLRMKNVSDKSCREKTH